MLHRPVELALFLGIWSHWVVWRYHISFLDFTSAGGWDHLDSYPRLSVVTKLVLSRQMCDLKSGHALRVRLSVTLGSINKLCESRLSAHMIEDRALTGKQYELVDGV